MKTNYLLIIILSLGLITCQSKWAKQILKDFEVVLYKHDFGRVNLMRCTITRDVDETEYKAEFSLTPQEKVEIYNAILSNGLLELPENYHPKYVCHGMHQAYYEMKICNLNKVHNINISNCEYDFLENFKVKKCRKVVDGIIMMVQEKDEVKKIPKSESLEM